MRILDTWPAKLMVRVLTDDGHEGWVNMVELSASPDVPGTAPSQASGRRLPRANVLSLGKTSPADRPASGPTATSGPSPSGQATVSRPVGKTVHTRSGEYELAGFGVRLGAFLVDLIVAVVVAFVLLFGLLFLVLNLSEWTTSSRYEFSWGAVGVWLQLAFYPTTAILWRFNATGRSPGMSGVGLRIIGDDGLAPGAGKGLGRTIGALVSGFAFGLGYLWAAWDGKNQTWHDKMTSTYVVRLG